MFLHGSFSLRKGVCVFHWNHLFSIIFSLWYLFSLTWKILSLALGSCQSPSCAHSSWVLVGGSCSDPLCCCHGSFTLHSQMLVTNQQYIEISPNSHSLRLMSSICAPALSEHWIFLLYSELSHSKGIFLITPHYTAVNTDGCSAWTFGSAWDQL